MAETHDLRRLYWHGLTYPDLRDWAIPVRMPCLTERATTREVDHPYRTGRARAFRLWPTRHAIVIGLWQPASGTDEVEALTHATVARDLPSTPAEIEAWSE